MNKHWKKPKSRGWFCEGCLWPDQDSLSDSNTLGKVEGNTITSFRSRQVLSSSLYFGPSFGSGLAPSSDRVWPGIPLQTGQFWIDPDKPPTSWVRPQTQPSSNLPKSCPCSSRHDVPNLNLNLNYRPAEVHLSIPRPPSCFPPFSAPSKLSSATSRWHVLSLVLRPLWLLEFISVCVVFVQCRWDGKMLFLYR